MTCFGTFDGLALPERWQDFDGGSSGRKASSTIIFFVFVFFRSLEHYRGIFFLTTNRVHDFDEAVCSRAHLFLRYNDLEAWAKQEIWSTFPQRARTIGRSNTISVTKLSRLVAVASNGRQVC
jgi:hypothetical protein